MKAIIFDADGVIVRPETWFFVPAEKNYGIPKKVFLEFIHGDFQRCTTGELELLEVLPPLLEQWGVKVSAFDFIQAWVKHEHHLDTVLLKQIQRIRAMGTPCFLATNQERNRALYLRQEMGLEAALDGVFVSSDLGVRKPMPAFYQRVQDALGLEPSEIFFWDDSVANVQAALAVGWQAKVFTPLAFDTWLKNFVERPD
jgi:HAD superfamily hydrolase (TIGR01509 family)